MDMISEQTRTKQSGSIVSFLIVGVVLVGLIVSGLYVLNRRHTADTTHKGPIATTNKVSSSPEASKPAVSSSVNPVPSRSSAPTPQAQKQPATTPSTGSPLPQTGPSDNLLSGFAFAILLGLTVAYVQSRRVRIETVYR